MINGNSVPIIGQKTQEVMQPTPLIAYDDEGVLKQLWEIIEIDASGNPLKRKREWKDIPNMNDVMSMQGEERATARPNPA